MSYQIQSDTQSVSLSQALRNMDQFSQPRNAPVGYTNLASLKVEDDDLSSQDNYSLCSSSHANGSIHDMHSWSFGDADIVDNAAALHPSSHKPESPEVQMLSYSLSHQLMPSSTVGPSDAMYQPGPEFRAFQDYNVDHNDMDYSQAQDFTHYSAFVDVSAFENDSNIQNGSQSCTDDSVSVGQSSSSHTDDGHMAASHESWNSMMHRSSLSGLPSSSSMFPSVPVSPPLTDSSNDFSVTSSCSHPGYLAFMANDDAMLKDITAAPSLSSHGINLGDPIYPLTPPLNERNPKG